MSNKVVISFSGGKDSVLALHKVIEAGYKPVALLTTIDKREKLSYFHLIRVENLKEISKSLNLPLILVETTPDEYEESFKKVILDLKKKRGVSGCVFGDIDILQHREWGENISKLSGVEPIFPLWNLERESLVKEFVNLGYRAIIKKVNLNYLSVEFLGKELSHNILNEMKTLGIDMCGENGEYHTLVIDGPIFSYPIEIKDKKVIIENGYGILDLEVEESENR